jgi:hypothetical protein
VLAGADLLAEKLVPPFCHCKIKRIDRVYEFQLDKKQLMETMHETSGEKLRDILLEEAGPLLSTFDSLL